MEFFAGMALKSVSPLAFSLALSLATLPMSAQSSGSGNPRTANREASSRLAGGYGKLPISFEPNQGQTDKAVQFVARGSGYMLFLEPDEAFMLLASGAPGADNHSRIPSTVDLKLVGADKTARGKGEDRLPGVSNYLFGKDPSKWRTDVPNFAKVRYTNVYPGIDLMYYGNQEGVLEHDFVVKPDADPAAISLVLQNAEKVMSGITGRGHCGGCFPKHQYRGNNVFRLFPAGSCLSGELQLSGRFRRRREWVHFQGERRRERLCVLDLFRSAGGHVRS